MQSVEPAAAAVTILASYLPAIADDTVRARCGSGLRDLYELVGERLAEGGMAGVFADFVLNPEVDFRVRRVLSVTVAADAGFAARLASAVAAARPADRFGAPPATAPVPDSAARLRALRRARDARARAGRHGGGQGAGRLRRAGGLGGVLAKFRGRF